jgi:hypothetical protein
MPTRSFGFPLPTPDGYTLHQGDYAHVFSTTDTQINGALLAHGKGVIENEDGNSFLVQANGARSVTVLPGKGILLRDAADELFTFLRTVGPHALTGLEDGEYFIFATAELDQAPGENNTFQSGIPLFQAAESDELEGGLLLARVTVVGGVVTVEDRRNFIEFEEAKKRIAQLEAEVDELRALFESLTNPAEPIPGGTSNEALLALIRAQGIAIDELRKELAEVKRNQTGDTPRRLRLNERDELSRAELFRLTGGVLHQFPGIALRLRGGYMIPGRTGMGQTMPDGTKQRQHYQGGNWTINSRARRWE